MISSWKIIMCLIGYGGNTRRQMPKNPCCDGRIPGSLAPVAKGLVGEGFGMQHKFSSAVTTTQRSLELTHGCKMIDLEHAYMVVQFFAKEDHVKVLTDGPWVVMSH